MPRRRQPAWVKPIAAGTADPAKVEAWAEGLSAAAALCRARRLHLWDLRLLKPFKGGHEEVWHCLRCGAEQEFITDARHRPVETSAVHYPDGYLAPRGAGRLDFDARGAFRGKFYDAFLEEHPDGVNRR